MARRRRAVERASQRQMVADRIIMVLLAIVGASGLMSLLPGSSQAAVSRFACQLGSLGLGSCTSSSLALGTEHLSRPRCTLLATLDQALPEVRVTRLVSDNGLPVEIGSTRSGTTFVRVGAPDDDSAPFVLAGESRGLREVLPGATVPAQAEWVLPSPDGVDAIVDAVDERHRVWVQRRSAIALVSAVFDRGGRDIPAPTTLFSQVRLDSGPLPRVAAEDLPAPKREASFVAISPQAAASYAYDRTTEQSSVVADLYGVVDRTPVSGSVRWTRDSSGKVTDVLVAVVSPRGLTPGDRNPSRVATEVAYLAVPVRTSAEQALVEGWLSRPGGFSLGLDEMLGLEKPVASDQLVAYLSRAATVTVLRYTGVDRSLATSRVHDELVEQRRSEWTDARLLQVSQVAPQANGTPRTVTADTTCLIP